MNPCPTRTFYCFLCFGGLLFFLHLSCSRDEETLRDTVLKEETVLISEEDSIATSADAPPEKPSVIAENDSTEIKEETEIIVIAKDLETRTTIFPVVQDAYLQNGRGYNLPIVRLQQDLRTSYLLFDLSPIDSIKGQIKSAKVEFTIDTDDGNGKIEVFKGLSTDWTEHDLSVSSAPEIDAILGSVQQEYRVKSKISIDLDTAQLSPRPTSLILKHISGNDLAFASKENERTKGSQLVVTYEVPVGAEPLIINSPQTISEEDSLEESEAEEVVEEGNNDATVVEESTKEEEVDGEASESEEVVTENVEVTQEDQKSEAEAIDEETSQEEEPTDGEEEVAEETENQVEETTEANSADETEVEETEQENSEEEIDQAENNTQTNGSEEEIAQETEESEEDENTGEENPNPLIPSNTAPLTVADATPTKGMAPLEVSFNAENSSDDKAITEYTWVFGDGNKSSKANPVHTYTQDGTYEVVLQTKDEEGLSSTDTIEIVVEAKENERPVAKASANNLSGIAPLEVDFSGSDSTDDNAVTKYFWDFQDGTTSDKENPTHTFDNPGTYEVELSVRDKEGLTDKDVLTITVNEPENETPQAIASADTISGEAPLKVNFTGSNSTDDNEIVRYEWDIPGNPSSEPNTTYTFDEPGTYEITLRVTDEEGLTDAASLTITVDEKQETDSGEGQITCSEGGKRADETGRKIWCWNNITIPEYTGRTGLEFSNNELAIDSECYEEQVSKEGNKIKFQVNPVGPKVGDWCYYKYNRRAEIRTSPWNVRNARGTEEWFGWSYTFSGNYKIDQANQWKFFQVHPGPKGAPQQISLEIIHGSQFRDHPAGEVYVVNRAHPTEGRSSDFSPTGIVPRAGQTINIVVHVIWESDSKGLLQVWIDDKKVYDKNVSTILDGYPWGGNAKWGIYKWTWRNEEAVQNTLQQGIKSLETSMGPLRVITRRPDDSNYGKNSYSEVVPN